MYAVATINEKIDEIRTEMKRSGLWQYHVPDWVKHFRGQDNKEWIEFTEWLQFVYLPNIENEQQDTFQRSWNKNIAPAAAKHFSKERGSERLLQLLIELDSL